MDNLVFGDYIAIKYTGIKSNNKHYLVKCTVCGHEKECGISNLRRQNNYHSKFNCKEDFYNGFVGKTFGDFTCVSVVQAPNKSWNLVLKCNVCGHVINKHMDSITELNHSASRCREDFYNSEIGKVYGDLEIIEIQGHNKYDEVICKCKCTKCGIESIRRLFAIRKGIYHGEECFKQIPDSSIKRAVAQRWYNMYERCNNPNNSNYKHYGARGILLKYESPVDLYLDFADELKLYAEIHGLRNSTFDRIDVNGNYEKGNIRIATQRVQSTNTTRRKFFILRNGDETIISDNAIRCGEYLGLNGRSIGNVVRGKTKSSGGWVLDRILSEDEDPYKIIEEKGVTTNLITSL